MSEAIALTEEGLLNHQLADPASPWFYDEDSFLSAKKCKRVTWKSRAMNKLSELKKLKENWDSYGAKRISPKALCGASAFINLAAYRCTSEPSIVPVCNGNIQIEWHEKGVELELEIESESHMHVYFHDIESGNEWEEFVTNDYTKLEVALDKLVD